MKFSPAALALLCLAACGSEQDAAPPLPKHKAPEAVAPTPAPAPAPAKELKAPAASGDAGAVLRQYYRDIEQRRYAEAYALREEKGADLAAFRAHFERFASQKVTVGAPTEPVEASGWLYVEVPIQTYGTMKDGAPFGSAGTVTLRRRNNGGAWRIYTK